jgi:hypothetical protein
MDIAETRMSIITILDRLVAVYGGEYDMSDVGTALYRQRRNGLLIGSDDDLASIAASVVATKWHLSDEARNEHREQILDTMTFEAAVGAEKAEKDARKQARKPAHVSETDPDYQRQLCCKIITNLQIAIGTNMKAHPRIVGMALASAIEDGDAENHPEALAGHASSAIWPKRHNDGFPAHMETACLQWIDEVAAACKTSIAPESIDYHLFVNQFFGATP